MHPFTLMLLACGSESPEPAAPAPTTAPSPVAAPAPTPEADPTPVPAAPATDGILVLSPGEGSAAEPPWNGIETFHGSYGSLVSPSASSELAAQGSATYGAKNMDDDDHKTAWVEGVSGPGIGEWVQFTYASYEPMWTCGDFVIVNGYQKSEKAFTENGRVKAFDLLVDGKKKAVLHLEDQPGQQAFRLPVSIGDTVRLVISDVYPGSLHEDTAITEMWLACAP